MLDLSFLPITGSVVTVFVSYLSLVLDVTLPFGSPRHSLRSPHNPSGGTPYRPLALDEFPVPPRVIPSFVVSGFGARSFSESYDDCVSCRHTDVGSLYLPLEEDV